MPKIALVGGRYKCRHVTAKGCSIATSQSSGLFFHVILSFSYIFIIFEKKVGQTQDYDTGFVLSLNRGKFYDEIIMDKKEA